MKGIAIGDSLLRPVEGLLSHHSDLSVIFKPGTTIDKLTTSLFGSSSYSAELWKDKKFVWILVGTNDVDNALQSKEGFKLGKFADSYRNLLLSILTHKRSIHIVCCSVVPRLVDFETTKPVLNCVNKKIRKLCNEFNTEFLSLDRAFCWTGIPQEPFYQRDRLHLSRRGALVLKKAIEKSFAEYRKHTS